MRENHQENQKGRNMFLFILLMGSFVAIAPVSTDIYLPALPGMEADLKAASGSAALTLSTWVLGVAFGQLIAGPFMDRFGRRVPLLTGTLIYAFASVGCAFSPSIPVLCLFRLIAAFSAGFSLVAPLACIREVAKGTEGARLLSRLALVQGIVPLLAPTIGGMLLSYMSWRVIFWGMAFYGFLSACLVFFVPETPSGNKMALKRAKGTFLTSLFEIYGDVLKDKSFRYYGSVWALQGIFVFSYLAAAPFIFEEIFNLTPTQDGILFGATAFVMISMTQINAALLKKFSTESLLRFSAVAGVLLALFFLFLSLISAQTLLSGDAGERAFWFLPVAASLLLLLCCFVMMGPNACACALFYQEKTAETAAGLAGSGLYFTGFISSLCMGFAPQGTAIPLAVSLLFVILLQLFFIFKAPALPKGGE